MKDNITYAISHEGTVGQNRVEMSFSNDAAGRAHLMSLLTDLYSNPIDTVVRELSCNGRDAQIEQGYNGPLEIIRPTPMLPFFEVLDHGTGMSVDFVQTKFAEFGTSTKRNTDDQTGFLGIGGKSPLTLTSQFTFVTVHNGVRTTVLVSRGDNGAGGVEVMDTAATEEPNGTRFKVPVDDIDAFNRAITRFFRWWPQGSVLVDGEEPDYIEPVMELDPWIKAYQNIGSDHVLMGGIAYPISMEHRLTKLLSRELNVVIEVPMGAVNFTPSREQLMYTDLTNETLEIARNWISQHILGQYQKKVSAQSTLAGAWREQKRANFQMASDHTFTWGGRPVPHIRNLQLPYPDPWDKTDETRSCWRVYPHMDDDFGVNVGSHHKARDIAVEDAAPDNIEYGACIVYGYPLKGCSTTVRKRLGEYVKDKMPRYKGKFFLIPEEHGRIHREWFEPTGRAIEWEDVAVYKVKRKKRKPPEKVGYQCLLSKDVRLNNKNSFGRRHIGYNPTAKHVTLEEMPERGRIVFYSPTECHRYRHDKYGHDYLGREIAALFKDATVVTLSRNRWEKFERDFPKAKHIRQVHAEVTARLLKNVTNEQKFMLSFGQEFRMTTLGRLAPVADKVDDPELQSFLLALGEDIDALESKVNLLNSIASRIGQIRLLRFEAPESVMDERRRMESRYPLAGAIEWGRLRGPDPILDYVNSYYNCKINAATDEED